MSFTNLSILDNLIFFSGSQPTRAIRRKLKLERKINRFILQDRTNTRKEELYVSDIADSNCNFRTLATLAHTASKHRVRILFYIWPLDDELLINAGYLDKDRFAQSKQMIAEAVNKESIYFADLSDILDSNYFSDIGMHCTVEGRRNIAEALTPRIVQILEMRSSL